MGQFEKLYDSDSDFSDDDWGDERKRDRPRNAQQKSLERYCQAEKGTENMLDDISKTLKGKSDKRAAIEQELENVGKDLSSDETKKQREKLAQEIKFLKRDENCLNGMKRTLEYKLSLIMEEQRGNCTNCVEQLANLDRLFKAQQRLLKFCEREQKLPEQVEEQKKFLAGDLPAAVKSPSQEALKKLQETKDYLIQEEQAWRGGRRFFYEGQRRILAALGNNTLSLQERGELEKLQKSHSENSRRLIKQLKDFPEKLRYYEKDLQRTFKSTFKKTDTQEFIDKCVNKYKEVMELIVKQIMTMDKLSDYAVKLQDTRKELRNPDLSEEQHLLLEKRKISLEECIDSLDKIGKLKAEQERERKVDYNFRRQYFALEEYLSIQEKSMEGDLSPYWKDRGTVLKELGNPDLPSWRAEALQTYLNGLKQFENTDFSDERYQQYREIWKGLRDAKAFYEKWEEAYPILRSIFRNHSENYNELAYFYAGESKWFLPEQYYGPQAFTPDRYGEHLEDLRKTFDDWQTNFEKWRAIKAERLRTPESSQRTKSLFKKTQESAKWLKTQEDLLEKKAKLLQEKADLLIKLKHPDSRWNFKDGSPIMSAKERPKAEKKLDDFNNKLQSLEAELEKVEKREQS